MMFLEVVEKSVNTGNRINLSWHLLQASRPGRGLAWKSIPVFISTDPGKPLDIQVVAFFTCLPACQSPQQSLVVLLNAWPLDLLHQHHLDAYKRCQPSGPTPDHPNPLPSISPPQCFGCLHTGDIC